MSVDTFRNAALGGGTFQATLTLNAAQVLSLNTTPVAFGLTVPAGYAVILTGAAFRLDWNSVAYDVGDVVEIRAARSADYQFRSNTGFLSSTADYFATGISGATSVNVIDGADIEVISDADSTVGDSPVTVYVTYMLIEL
jgi:hypothetical protein